MVKIFGFSAFILTCIHEWNQAGQKTNRASMVKKKFPHTKNMHIKKRKTTFQEFPIYI